MVDLSADFRLDRERYERWYQPHDAPELLGEAVYGLTEAHRDEIRGAELVAAPGCYPTAALLALWPLREHIARRGRRRQVRRLRRRPRGHPDHALRLRHRERAGLQGRGPPPRGRARAGAERARPSRSCRICCRRAGPARQLLRDDRRSRRPSVRDLYRDAYEDEPFIDLVDEPPGTDDVRETNRCRIHVTVGGEPRDRARRDRQPLEGRRRPGRAGPQPDARACRRRRGSSERPLLPLALGRGARARDASSSRTRCRPASGPPAWRRASSRRASTWASCLRRAGHGLRRALHDQRAPRRAGHRLQGGRARPPARGRGELRAARTWATASAASRPRVAMQAAAAEELGIEPEQVAVASTGVIGVELPRDRVVARRARGVRRARRRRGRLLAGHPHQRRRPRSAPASRSTLPSGTVRLAAQAKGAGMISPRHATMFCFVQTDAALDAERSTCSPASA